MPIQYTFYHEFLIKVFLPYLFSFCFRQASSQNALHEIKGINIENAVLNGIELKTSAYNVSFNKHIKQKCSVTPAQEPSAPSFLLSLQYYATIFFWFLGERRFIRRVVFVPG